MVAVAVQPLDFPWLDLGRYRFSAGVRHGGHVWLAGNTASVHDRVRDTVVVEGPMRDQAEIAWDKVTAVLAGAGLGLESLSRVVEYVTVEGLADYEEAVAVRRERLAGCGGSPAVNTVVVERLVRPGALLEVEATAEGSPPGGAGAGGRGEVVALPTLLGRGPTLADQVADVLGRAIALLGELGLGAANIVATTECTLPATRSEYRATAAVRRTLLGPDFPTATGILTSRLPDRQVADTGAGGSRDEDGPCLIALDVTASRQPKTCLPAGPLTFSPAVRAGDLVWVSGITAIDARSGEVRSPGDVAGQAEVVYDTIGSLIAALGGRGLEDLVKTVEWVAPAGMAGYRGVGAVRGRMLSEPWPASTGLGCSALLQPDWLIEVTSLAAVG